MIEKDTTDVSYLDGSLRNEKCDGHYSLGLLDCSQCGLLMKYTSSPEIIFADLVLNTVLSDTNNRFC